MIKAGKLSDYMDKNDEMTTFFLSSAVIPDLPSTKKRSRLKRAIVIAMEIEEIRRDFDPSRFPLANLKRRGLSRG